MYLQKELYLAFKGFLLLILWISIILEDKLINKNKITTKTSFWKSYSFYKFIYLRNVWSDFSTLSLNISLNKKRSLL